MSFTSDMTKLLKTAIRPKRRISTVLIMHSFLCTLAGVILLWLFSYSSSFELLQNLKSRTRSSQRFSSFVFAFLWIACFLATKYKKVELLAVATGLFCAIVTVVFPLEDLDAIRQTLRDGGLRDLRLVACGEVLSYIGALTGYLAIACAPKPPASLKRRASTTSITSGQRIETWYSPAKFRPILTALATILCITGCALLWTSDACQYTGLRTNYYRAAIFSMADISIVVTFVFTLSYWTTEHAYIWLAAVLTGAYGIPLLNNYYNIADGLEHDEDQGRFANGTSTQVAVGSWMLFSTHVVVLICCILLSQAPKHR
eukprot:m.103097 g.103097  ORF g.103097 m.103097 type:complete len:315 (-) comp15030_c5_seq1:181-1125(-)